MAYTPVDIQIEINSGSIVAIESFGTLSNLVTEDYVENRSQHKFSFKTPKLVGILEDIVGTDTLHDATIIVLHEFLLADHDIINIDRGKMIKKLWQPQSELYKAIQAEIEKHSFLTNEKVLLIRIESALVALMCIVRQENLPLPFASSTTKD